MPGRQIRSRRCDGLDAGLFIARDNRDRLALVRLGMSFFQHFDFTIDTQNLGHLPFELDVTIFKIEAYLVRPRHHGPAFASKRYVIGRRIRLPNKDFFVLAGAAMELLRKGQVKRSEAADRRHRHHTSRLSWCFNTEFLGSSSWKLPGFFG
ncbi:MAG: hypothetical protein QOJ84_5294 [Bradyrhizobium sp.]|jgi:hypothetical protein|nr:hypothetical protein [Bradyrhizobium sp.]